jgi:tetratricopeptide (TPR) repeat protein
MSRKSLQHEASSERIVDSTNDVSDNDFDGWWDLAPAAGNKNPEPEEKQSPEPDSPGEIWAESLHDSWDSFTSQLHQATLHRDSEDSNGEEGDEKSFTLPQAAFPSSQAIPEAGESGANWSSLLAQTTGAQREPTELDDLLDDSLAAPPSPPKVSPWAPRKSEESQSKTFGRSAEVQEAPLHDSWSSGSGDSPPISKKLSWGGLASAEKDSLHDSWSTGESSQEQGSRKSGWAAALQAAREPTDDESPFDKEPIQGTEMPRPFAVEDIPEDEPADTGSFENLPQPTGETREKKGGVLLLRRLLTVLLVLLGLGSLATASYHYFANRTAVQSDSRTPGADSPPADDVTIWLASAQESLDSKDYKLAAPQLEKAISFLKKGKGEEGQLKETQVLLATTYGKAGDYTASATLWTELAKSHPDLKKKGKAAAAAALRENRIIAKKKVKAGEKAVTNKKFDKAIKVANEALDIYAVSQGQNSQMARAHGVLGDAYRGEQNTRIAFFHFTEASKLDPQGRYKSELSKLRLPVRPKPRAKPAKRVKPKFVIKTGVPQANGKR